MMAVEHQKQHGLKERRKALTRRPKNLAKKSLLPTKTGCD